MNAVKRNLADIRAKGKGKIEKEDLREDSDVKFAVRALREARHRHGGLGQYASRWLRSTWIGKYDAKEWTEEAVMSLKQ